MFRLVALSCRGARVTGVCHASSLPTPRYASPKPQVDYTDLSAIAMKLYEVGIESVGSKTMIDSVLKLDSTTGQLELYQNGSALSEFQPYKMEQTKVAQGRYTVDKNIHVVAVGKAVVGMCQSVEDILKDHIVRGLAFVPASLLQNLKASWQRPLLPSSKIELISGGNGEESLQAAKRVLKLAESLQAGDILLTLVSGGASSLLMMPKSPLTLQDKLACIQLMKEAHVPHLEQTVVRKNLSGLKGGGLSAAAAPAQVISLVLSNLSHNMYKEVAGGLTTSDNSTPQQALEILRKHQLVNKVSPAVIKLLEKEAKSLKSIKQYSEVFYAEPDYASPETRGELPDTLNILAGSNEIAVRSMLDQCVNYEIPAHYLEPSDTPLSVARCAEMFSHLALYAAAILTRGCRSKENRELVQIELDCIRLGISKKELKRIVLLATDATNLKKPMCLVFTSEIAGDFENGNGKGGICQEVALSTALSLQGMHERHDSFKMCDVQLVSLDSDGNDGGSDVAGAIADYSQASQVVLGKTAQQYLDEHDSYTFYANLQDGRYHVRTGATGIDIHNFQLLLLRNKTW